jgi:hypothetical protein
VCWCRLFWQHSSLARLSFCLSCLDGFYFTWRSTKEKDEEIGPVPPCQMKKRKRKKSQMFLTTAVSYDLFFSFFQTQRHFWQKVRVGFFAILQRTYWPRIHDLSDNAKGSLCHYTLCFLWASWNIILSKVSKSVANCGITYHIPHQHFLILIGIILPYEQPLRTADTVPANILVVTEVPHRALLTL